MSDRRIPSPEVLNQETGRGLMKAAREQKLHKGDTLVIDLSQTQSMDTRGGAWMNDPRNLRAAHRVGGSTALGFNLQGFRVARDMQ